MKVENLKIFMLDEGKSTRKRYRVMVVHGHL